MRGATKSERCYHLRAEGLTWADIVSKVSPEVDANDAHALDVAKKSLSRSAKRWAIRRGMAWPPEAEQEVLPTLKTQEAWDRKEQEYQEALAGGDLTSGARQWAQEHDLPWPPPGRSPQERCYNMKAEGKSWEEIQAAGGYKHLHHTIEAARRWAFANDLPWPLPGMRDNTLAGWQQRQARAYELHQDGSPIEEIMEETGYTSKYTAYKGIRSHARRNGLPDPLVDTLTRKVDTSRESEVVRLRDRKGWSWPKIRDHLGYHSTSGPRKAYSRHKEKK